MSLRNRTAERRGRQKRLCDKRDRAITCVLCRDPHLTLMFSGLCRNICLKESEVWRKVFSNKIVTLVTQVCHLLSSPVLLRKFTYDLEGCTFSLSNCDFSRLFHTERSWHTYRFTVLFVSGLKDFPLMQEHILWPQFLKRQEFYYGWIRVLIFSKVPSGSEYKRFLLVRECK